MIFSCNPRKETLLKDPKLLEKEIYLMSSTSVFGGGFNAKPNQKALKNLMYKFTCYKTPKT